MVLRVVNMTTSPCLNQIAVQMQSWVTVYKQEHSIRNLLLEFSVPNKLVGCASSIVKTLQSGYWYMLLLGEENDVIGATILQHKDTLLNAFERFRFNASIKIP